MTDSTEKLETRATEKTTLHFSFPKKAKQVYTFNHSMTSVKLAAHTPQTLAAARHKMPLLRAIPDEHLTHFVDVALPSDCILMTYVTTERIIDGVTVQHPVHFGLHVPRKGRESARMLFRSRRNEAQGIHPKLSRLGLTAEQVTNHTNGDVDPEFPSHIETLQDATDAAVALLFQHGSLINLSAERGGVVSAIIEQHILEAVKSTMELPLAIFMAGDNWLETKVVPIPGTDRTTTSTSPCEDVRNTVTGPLQMAIVTVQNDPALEGYQWNINYGVTTDSYDGDSEVAQDKYAATLSRDMLEGDGADRWTSANKSVMNGLSVDAGSVVYTPAAKAPTWLATGVWSVNDIAPDQPLRPATVTALMDGKMFIQVTSPEYSNGYLRGKLQKQATDATTGITKFTAELTGAAVIPAVKTTASGTATFELNVGGTGISYSVSVSGIAEDNISAGLYIGDESERAGEPLRAVKLTNTTGLGSLTLKVTNKWLRHLSACVEYLDSSGQPLRPKGWNSRIPGFLQPIFEPNPWKPFVALIPPVSTVFGIPIPPDPTTITVPIWEEVHSVRILMGGMGRGDYDGAVCPVGITVTALAELALPVFILFAGTSISNSKAVTSLLADKEVLFAICAAGSFLVSGASAAYIGTAQNPMKAVEELAVKFGPMLLSPATSLGLWVAEQVIKGAAERAAPFVNIGLLVLNGAVTAAQLSQTIIEVLSSPFVYETRITRSMGLKVKLTPDIRYHKFPDHHAYMQVKVVYDSGSTQPVYQSRLPATPLSDPINIQFQDVPAGGNLRVFAFFFAANGWQSGQGSTGWLRATSNKGSVLDISELMINTNQIPLTTDSRYVHQAKITMVNGEIGWKAAINAPPAETVMSPAQFPDKQILALGSVTFAQQPEMIGYTWQATGLNVSPDTESNPKSNDAMWTMQNLSVLQRPLEGYAVPKVGFTHQPGIAYNMASADNSETNFYIDSSNSGFDIDHNQSGGYQVRGVKLAFDGPPPVFSTTSNLSYGRFPEPIDKYVYHPGGFMIGISFSANKLYRLELLAKPVADKDAPHAVMSSGTGTREGLMRGPAGLAVALDGRLLVLESQNARVQAFDIFGNPVLYFAGTGATKSSVLNLVERAGSTYLDISVESQGYIYVLSYTGEGGSAKQYQVDIYKPDGSFLVTTPNVAAAKIVVDILRNMFTLNYETFLDKTNRVQPSVSMWLPPAPSVGMLASASDESDDINKQLLLESKATLAVNKEDLNTTKEISEFVGQWGVRHEGSNWVYTSTDGMAESLNFYKIGTAGYYDLCVAQANVPPRRRDVTGPAALYYADFALAGNYCTKVVATEKNLQRAFVFGAFPQRSTIDYFPNSNPTGLPDPHYGMFDMGHGARCFGFNVRRTLPYAVPYSHELKLPGAAYIRRYQGGKAVSFSKYHYINLAKNDFSNLQLFNADFFQADLTETKFDGAKLQGAIFDGCFSIRGASFKNANLTGSRFIGVNLADIDFSGADLTSVDLSKCTGVAGAKFNGAILFRTNFTGLTDFTNTDFTGANMKGTIFGNNDLTKAKFSPTPTFADNQDCRTEFISCKLLFSTINLNWNYLDLSFATIMNMPPDMQKLTAQSAILKGLVFTNTNFRESNFTNSIMHGCSFAKCGLAKAIFRGAQLQGEGRMAGCVFSEADLFNAVFAEANLTGTNFTGAYFWGANATVAGAVVVRAVFSNAYLVGIDFSGVAQKQCQGAIFDYSCLINAKFNGTNAGKYEGQSSSFVRACLQGVDFSGSALEAANFTSAAIAQVAGSINVKIKIGWPLTNQTLPIAFKNPTVGFEQATTITTICPSTDKGQCTIAKQAAVDAPTEWPVRALHAMVEETQLMS